MIRRYCDRCYKEICKGPIYLLNTEDFDEINGIEQELCDECQRSLVDWFKHPAKRYTPERRSLFDD